MKVTLRSARVNKDLTIEKASQLIGVNESTLRSWEKGRYYPSKKEYIDKICEVYEASYDDIIFLPRNNA